MKMQKKPEKFEVAYLFTEEVYIVIQGGIAVGMPQFFSKKENAQKYANELNILHDLGEQSGEQYGKGE